MSPVHLDYTYTQAQLNRAKILGNTLKVGLSKSPFKTISGKIKIRIPDKKAIEEGDSVNVRGPFGTFKEEVVEEEQNSIFSILNTSSDTCLLVW